MISSPSGFGMLPSPLNLERSAFHSELRTAVMIIVAGRIYVRPESRSEFLMRSADAMEQARQAPGCLDFVVAADPLEADRINVFEEWTDREALEAFRESGPDDQMSSLIVRAAVAEHEVNSNAR